MATKALSLDLSKTVSMLPVLPSAGLVNLAAVRAASISVLRKCAQSDTVVGLPSPAATATKISSEMPELALAISIVTTETLPAVATRISHLCLCS